MTQSLRSLPRLFVTGASPDADIDLPSEELHKLRTVLRLSPGATIAVLPDDGTLIECELLPKAARPVKVHSPDTEPLLQITLAQSLPKGDKLEEIVRACTEIGVCRFLLFNSDRTVVRWDEKKVGEKLRRLQAIAREAAEVSFRTRLPSFETASNLEAVLEVHEEAIVLSESEQVLKALTWRASTEGSAEASQMSAPSPVAPLPRGGDESQHSTDHRTPNTEGLTPPITLVVGPEGGWSPRELALIGDRGVTLGPRVLRVDHAGFAAAALLLIRAEQSK